jgi:hypothetical protein
LALALTAPLTVASGPGAILPVHESGPQCCTATILVGQGLIESRDFVVRGYEGATHNEASWRARLGDPLTFLFGPRPR